MQKKTSGALGVHDCLTGGNLVCFLGRGETEREVRILCEFLKEKLKDEPKSITTDYKPAWDLGIKKVFPNTLLIRDAFHTVQLMNRAILKELHAISKHVHETPIKETKALYQHVKKDAWHGTSRSIMPVHKTVKEFTCFYSLLITLYNIEDVHQFRVELETVMAVLKKLDSIHALLLWNELTRRFPENGLTRRNVKYYKNKLKGAFSLVMREFRRQLERAKKEFTIMKYLLLKREENLSDHESRSLHEFLRTSPEYKKYRDLSLRVSNIYHVPPSTLTDSMITGITLWDDATAPLRAAVTTLQKNVREIFNFKRVFSTKVPDEFYKKVRTGPEHAMRKIKDVVRNRFGFRTPDTSQFHLEHELHCMVIIDQGQKAQIAS